MFLMARSKSTNSAKSYQVLKDDPFLQFTHKYVPEGEYHICINVSKNI